jgi:hypothetical protein
MTAPKTIAIPIRMTRLAVCLTSGRPDSISSKIISIVDQSCFYRWQSARLFFFDSISARQFKTLPADDGAYAGTAWRSTRGSRIGKLQKAATAASKASAYHIHT